MVTSIEPKREVVTPKGEVSIPMLSGGATCVADVPGFWTVAHCRSRHEKTLALVAEDSGFGYFLPLEVRRVKRQGHGTAKLQTPFPALDGYVFLSSTSDIESGYPIPQDLHDFLEAQYSFFSIIEVRPSQQARLITDLERLHETAKRGAIRTKLMTGSRCEVVRGSFMGCEGLISGDGRVGYVKVEVDAIKYAEWVEIPIEDLQPI